MEKSERGIAGALHTIIGRMAEARAAMTNDHMGVINSQIDSSQQSLDVTHEIKVAKYQTNRDGIVAVTCWRDKSYEIVDFSPGTLLCRSICPLEYLDFLVELELMDRLFPPSPLP